ncbi:hypothetical protein HYR69_05180 [Candidatus Sumerlaeota bacterium]|nr:hypothetical protein [Candidatus Sumerlaeota bacterium]
MNRIQSKTLAHFAAKLALALTLTFALAGSSIAADKPKKAKKAESPAQTLPDPYPLDVCIVSGQKLGEMGDPIIKVYDGREIRFCCPACPKKFEADKAGYLKKLDEAIVAQQKPIYPTDLCIVSGEKLGGDMGDPVDVVLGNRLVRNCCKGCNKDLLANPAKFIGMLDEKVIAAQKTTYPLETCVVSGDKLGSMGAPVDYVFAGRLVRLCCKDHVAKFLANPSLYLKKLDEAAKSKTGKSSTPETKKN